VEVSHQRFFEGLDPRLTPELLAEFERRRGARLEGVPRASTIVLAGHRAAGKSTLLPRVASWFGRLAVDLDAEIERRSGRRILEWLPSDQASFRAFERQTFSSLPPGLVVAVGGGFLEKHPELLGRCFVVLVPVSFETYRERLLPDESRPRLRPLLTKEQELSELWAEREASFEAFRPKSWVDLALVLDAKRPQRALRVVTLPPGADAIEFAQRARKAGADLLEVRSDLTPIALDLSPVADVLPLLVVERRVALPAAWVKVAAYVDRELNARGVREPNGHGISERSVAGVESRIETEHATALGQSLERIDVVSFHAAAPMTPSEAAAAWAQVAETSLIKHVEPLGSPRDASRLGSTWRLLADKFGPQRVTVLATGSLALPLRAVLSENNAFDYVALDAGWKAAEGQRLLDDAVREALHAPAPGGRLGIVGQKLEHSRSPRLHVQPFDRIELPIDVDLEAWLGLAALHYRGLAVTHPFKKRVAEVVKAEWPAVNTLVRSARGWRAYNTDVAGARLVLEEVVEGASRSLGARVVLEALVNGAIRRPPETAERMEAVAAVHGAVTVLGDGGATHALHEAAAAMGIILDIRRQDADFTQPLSGAVVWTWPSSVGAPAALRFERAHVAIVAYGQPAREIAANIRARGGRPMKLGFRWLIAQARLQKALWAEAS
jgi:shikimate kinase